MPHILFAQNGFVLRDFPVDAQTFIKDRDAVIGLRSIEIVALILKDCRFAQDRESMSESLWDEELKMILLRKLNRHVLTIRGAAFADIHRHVQHGTTNATNQFSLCERRTLEMQTTHHAVSGFAFIILDEDDLSDFFIEFPLREGFEEIAATIFEYSRFY